MSQVTNNLVKLKTMKVKLIVFLAIGAILAPMFVIGAMMGSFAPTKDKTGGNTGGFGSIGMAQVSADVLKWRPLVEKHAATFQMTPYVDLILALIQQESGGTLIDVMQSAEGAYNTKYPKMMNGITDSDYSIWCGVQELKHSLELAEVQGPNDIDRIKLALQTYNMGPGFINHVKANGGVYSVDLAKSFALKHANGRTQCGFRSPYCYGDFTYVEKVLKNLVIVQNPTGGGDGKGTSIANQKFNEIMALVSPYDGYPYVWAGRAPPNFDCSGLIEWSYNKLGIRISGTAEDMYNQTIPVTDPAPGDLVFFKDTYRKGISHIGIYIGNNRMFNAGGTHLHYAELSKPYWAEHFVGIRRLPF